MNEFVISDESVNRYGFKVLTSGINLVEFKKNPVMYYNHQRELGVIGRWKNIRTDGDKLLATPVFDMNDELGLKISNKVESGFIRAASIGIQKEVIPPDTYTVNSCELIECSICDIPANKNAIMLYHDDKPVKDIEGYMKLILTKKINYMNDNDLKIILTALDLSSGATVNDILGRIEILKGEEPGAMIENAIRLNYIQSYEKEGLLQMGKANPGLFGKYMNDRKVKLMDERKKEFNTLIDEARRDNRLNFDGRLREFFEKSFEMDYEGTKYALSVLPKKLFVRDIINKTDTGYKTGWTLSDYRKKNPRELSMNSGLYNRLLEEEKERTSKNNNK